MGSGAMRLNDHSEQGSLNCHFLFPGSLASLVLRVTFATEPLL
jgi:hypothetical protein